MKCDYEDCDSQSDEEHPEGWMILKGLKMNFCPKCVAHMNEIKLHIPEAPAKEEP